MNQKHISLPSITKSIRIYSVKILISKKKGKTMKHILQVKKIIITAAKCTSLFSKLKSKKTQHIIQMQQLVPTIKCISYKAKNNLLIMR